jgi:hypothetical protein
MAGFKVITEIRERQSGHLAHSFYSVEAVALTRTA